MDSRADGALMGTEIQSKDGTVEVAVDVIGTKPIVEVALIRDGKRLAAYSGDGNTWLRDSQDWLS